MPARYQLLETAAHIIGRRWRTILICSLLDGPKRFSDLQKNVGIARRILTVNLRELEEAGIVIRTAYAEVPPRVEYALTIEGQELRPLIDNLCAWGKKFKDRQEQKGRLHSNPSSVE